MSYRGNGQKRRGGPGGGGRGGSFRGAFKSARGGKNNKPSHKGQNNRHSYNPPNEYGEKSHQGYDQSYDQPQQYEEAQPYQQQPYDQQPYDQQPYDQQPYEQSQYPQYPLRHEEQYPPSNGQYPSANGQFAYDQSETPIPPGSVGADPNMLPPGPAPQDQGYGWYYQPSSLQQQGPPPPPPVTTSAGSDPSQRTPLSSWAIPQQQPPLGTEFYPAAGEEHVPNDGFAQVHTGETSHREPNDDRFDLPEFFPGMDPSIVPRYFYDLARGRCFTAIKNYNALIERYNKLKNRFESLRKENANLKKKRSKSSATLKKPMSRDGKDVTDLSQDDETVDNKAEELERKDRFKTADDSEQIAVKTEKDS